MTGVIIIAIMLSSHICKRHTGSIRAIQLENNRDNNDPHDFPLSKIDWNKTNRNEYLMRSDNWMADIKNELSKYGIEKYRKNAVLLIDVLYSASADFFSFNDPETVKNYFEDCFHFHDSKFGHIINAVIHFDETTPHMHVVSVPIVKRENGYSLCARELIGGKQKLYEFHDHLYNDVGIYYDLERGKRSDSVSKKRHLSMYEYKLNCLELELSSAVNDLERLRIDIDKAGSVRDLFSTALSISSEISILTNSLGGNLNERILSSVESRENILDRVINNSGFHIQNIEKKPYCCILDSSGSPLSWNSNIPLYIQDGNRLIPSSYVCKDGYILPWNRTDICNENRDQPDSTPVEKLHHISDELEMLIDRIEDETDVSVDDIDAIDCDEENEIL